VSDDLGERYKRANARLLEWRERFKHFREWLVYLQETVWEPAVRAALHGDFGPAREKWRKGDKPPSQARAMLEEAWVRLQTGCGGRLPKGKPPVYRGPLWRLDLTHTDRLRAVRKYEELMAEGRGKEEALQRAVEWVNKNPRQNPARLVERRIRGKVTVDQLRYEIEKRKTRQKLRDPD
jgi:uncharacterized protein YoaH (UPF0181 family)